MKKSVKILSLVLAVCMAVCVFAACGGNTDNTPSGTPADTKDAYTNAIQTNQYAELITKIFRIEVPHDGFEEVDSSIEFKVGALVNYGDVKLYKCNGELYGDKVTVYINKERDIELGSSIFLSPKLEKTQIYEDDRNIRLY